MWSLLWIRLPRRVLFWGKLFFVVSTLHLCLLFMMFFIYSGQKSVFTVNINRLRLKSGAPIIFMPLKKSVQKPVFTKRVSKKLVSKNKIKKVVKKNVIKKTVKKPVLAKKKASVKKVIPKKKKPVIQKKTIIKKKLVSEEKRPVLAKKIVPKKKPVVQEKTAKSIEKVAKEQKKIEAIYVGQQELEALKVQYEIEREVTKHWVLPVGLSKELSCVISVLVDWNGTAKKVTVTKSSGALMFDIAARTAVAKLCLPKSVHGKEVNINFG